VDLEVVVQVVMVVQFKVEQVQPILVVEVEVQMMDLAEHLQEQAVQVLLLLDHQQDNL
jgi:hypothetical protein